MHLLNLVQSHTQLFEVVASDARDFSAVDEHQKLGLNSCIEVAFDFWGNIAVDPDVVELRILGSQVFVVLLDILANGVPSCCEVEQSVDWPKTVEVLNNVETTLAVGYHVVLSMNSVHVALRHHIY